MSRCRFVEPKAVRLHLADVHRRALRAIEERLAKERDKKIIKSLNDELDQARARVQIAEADAEWLDVKGELNAGEARRTMTGVIKTMRPGEKTELDPDKVAGARLAEYVIGWSLTDRDGQPVPFSLDALDALDQDTYEEIIAALDAHEESVEKVRAERKNGRSGERKSSATSPSAA